MVAGAAPSGGSAVRWTYGAFLTLCLALAVLVHHETAAMGASRMTGASPVLRGAAHAGHVAPGEAVPTAWEPFFSHGVDSGGCDAPDMRHCSMAGISSPQLVEPTEDRLPPLSDLPEGVAASVPSSSVERAPPDLSVLSRLRI
ncbi:hypothetical protein RKD23_007649 [Streptomyces sp. SAI-170]|uniref:hypothetical protein n=1 Tax=Streptomyces sp. SAI-170 TaxID=3377729 RepID=UPI003C7CB4C5